MQDQEIQNLVARLGRDHPSGGTVVERAALLAEGADFTEVVAWITAHHGEPEMAVSKASAGRGLHAERQTRNAGIRDEQPLRFVVPAGAFETPEASA